MSKVKFAAVKELIAEKKYNEARKILKTIDHPMAREWEAKLDKLDQFVVPEDVSAKSTKKKSSQAPKTSSRRIYNGVRGCLIVVVVLVILALLSSSPKPSATDAATSNPDVRPSPSDPAVTTIIPTVVANRSGFVTITPAAGTVYPTATVTDTELPTATNTDLPTTTPAPLITPMEPQIYYTVSTVNLRSCPSTDCSIVQKVSGGAALAVDGIVEGEAIDAGNPYWYKVEQSETDEYGYSKFFSLLPPAQLQQNAQTIATIQVQMQQPTIAPVQQQVIFPDNCSTAVAMGLSPQEAAKYPGLDANHNGVACYGN